MHIKVNIQCQFKIYIHKIKQLIWTSRKRNHYSIINANLVKPVCKAPLTKFIHTTEPVKYLFYR